VPSLFTVYIAIVSILHIGDLFMAFQKRLYYEVLQGGWLSYKIQKPELAKTAVSGKHGSSSKTIQKFLLI